MIFQVSNTIVERHTDDSSNVLTKYPSGPEFLNHSKHFWPEETVICFASALPGKGYGLAGEAA